MSDIVNNDPPIKSISKEIILNTIQDLKLNHPEIDYLILIQSLDPFYEELLIKSNLCIETILAENRLNKREVKRIFSLSDINIVYPDKSVWNRKTSEDDGKILKGYEQISQFDILYLKRKVQLLKNEHKITNITKDLDKDLTEDFNTDFNAIKTPKQLKELLDEYVIGQDEAKKTLSVAVYNHLKRIKINENSDKNALKISKSNVIMIGDSGTGKTLIAETLAKVLDLPFITYDSTTLTSAGYSGNDVEDVILRLVEKAGGKDYIPKAEKGIIYLDEIDKISKKERSGKDISGEALQHSLLKIIEGDTFDISSTYANKHKAEKYRVNTKNILFICGGSFNGLKNIIYKNSKKNKTIGFNNNSTDESFSVTDRITPDLLVQFGMIQEFVARFNIITQLKPLSEEILLRILTEPKDSIISQAVELMRFDGIEIEFTKEALVEIVQIAIKKNIGARGLKSVVENVMEELYFILPDMKLEIEKVIIDKEGIYNPEKVQMINRS